MTSRNKDTWISKVLIIVFVFLIALLGYLLLKPSHAANADINGDGKVDILDLSILASNFGQSGKTFAQGDLTGDGIVNVFDLSVLASNWGGGGTTANSTTPCVSASAPAAWKHLIVIMLENHTYSGGTTPGVIGSPLAPYITSMAAKCGSYKNWHDADYKVDGVTKDGTYNSKPNYATLTNGVSPTVHGLLDDTSSTTTGVDNIYNQLRTAGKSGKDYFDPSSFNSSTLTFTENTTATGCSAGFNGGYHDAIRYYTDIDSTYCNAHDVNISTFMNDVNGTLPEFSFVLPQNCRNMHSCSPYTADQIITNGDTWLSNFLPPLLDSARYKSGDTAVFVLWDEDTPIPNILMAPSIKPGTLATLPSGFTNPFSHFSALRTWEEMLGLPLLGNTGSAPSLLNFYNGH